MTGTTRAPLLAPLRLARVLLLGIVATGAPVAAAPALFPATPNGPAEVRDERDVAPFLAGWKAEALARTRRMQLAATPNQQAYDVRWYDLDLTFNPAGGQISGTVRVQARVVSGTLNTMELDLSSSLGVTAVSSAGLPTTSARVGDLVIVNLDRVYSAGELL